MIIAFGCSLLEACLMSLSLADIANITEKRQAIGSIWKNFRDNIQKPIATILVINTLATTMGAALSGTQFARLFGVKWVWLYSLIFAIMMIQWSEILPKTLGYRHNRLVAMVFGLPLEALVIGMTPLLSVTQFLRGRLPVSATTRAPTPWATSTCSPGLLQSTILSVKNNARC